MERDVVVNARAVFATRLRAQDAGNRRARVIDGDHAERFIVFAARDKRIVLRDLLVDGTAAVFTRRFVEMS